MITVRTERPTIGVLDRIVSTLQDLGCSMHLPEVAELDALLGAGDAIRADRAANAQTIEERREAALDKYLTDGDPDGLRRIAVELETATATTSGHLADLFEAAGRRIERRADGLFTSGERWITEVIRPAARQRIERIREDIPEALAATVVPGKPEHGAPDPFAGRPTSAVAHAELLMLWKMADLLRRHRVMPGGHEAPWYRWQVGNPEVPLHAWDNLPTFVWHTTQGHIPDVYTHEEAAANEAGTPLPERETVSVKHKKRARASSAGERVQLLRLETGGEQYAGTVTYGSPEAAQRLYENGKAVPILDGHAVTWAQYEAATA